MEKLLDENKVEMSQKEEENEILRKEMKEK